MTCIQCYAHTEVSDYTVKEEFYSLLDRAISSSNIGDILVVMGDFNAQIGPDNSGLESIMGTHALGRRTENGELFVNMCAANNLVIGGSLFPHKSIHKVTWVSPDHQTENQIDHITISRKWRGSLLDVRCKRGADIASDHQLVVASVRIKLMAVNKNLQAAHKKFDVDRLSNPAVALNYTTALRQLLLSTSREDRKNFQKTKWIVTEAAKTHIGFKTQRCKQWISDDTWSLIAKRKVLKAALNSAKTRNLKADLCSQHTSLDRLVKRSARRDKRNWANNIAKEAQAAADTNRSGDLYKLIKKLTNKPNVSGRPIRNDDGTLITSKDKQLDLWAEYYSAILSPESNQEQPVCYCTTYDNSLNIPTTH